MKYQEEAYNSFGVQKGTKKNTAQPYSHTTEYQQLKNNSHDSFQFFFLFFLNLKSFVKCSTGASLISVASTHSSYSKTKQKNNMSQPTNNSIFSSKRQMMALLGNIYTYN